MAAPDKAAARGVISCGLAQNRAWKAFSIKSQRAEIAGATIKVVFTHRD
ncbi:hypothetical protein ACX3O0_08210 [Homoserinimonas sp. A447]